MTITTIGIDLAKNVFQVHGVDKVAAMQRFANWSGVTNWLRSWSICHPAWLGWRLAVARTTGPANFRISDIRSGSMSPQFVKPYVKSNKNDAADAEAICEAVTRPNMRFVPIKSVEQQAVLSMNRVRQGFVTARTAQANQIRGPTARVWHRAAKGDQRSAKSADGPH